MSTGAQGAPRLGGGVSGRAVARSSVPHWARRVGEGPARLVSTRVAQPDADTVVHEPVAGPADTAEIAVAGEPGVLPGMTALRALPSVQRRALVLCHAKGMTPGEIAAQDGVAIEVVTRRLAHGALAFAHLLGGAGHGSPEVVVRQEVARLGSQAVGTLEPARPLTPAETPPRRRLRGSVAFVAAAAAAVGAVGAAAVAVHELGASTSPSPAPPGTSLSPGGSVLPPGTAGPGGPAPGAADPGQAGPARPTAAAADLGLRPGPVAPVADAIPGPSAQLAGASGPGPVPVAAPAPAPAGAGANAAAIAPKASSSPLSSSDSSPATSSSEASSSPASSSPPASSSSAPTSSGSSSSSGPPSGSGPAPDSGSSAGDAGSRDAPARTPRSGGDDRQGSGGRSTRDHGQDGGRAGANGRGNSQGHGGHGGRAGR